MPLRNDHTNPPPETSPGAPSPEEHALLMDRLYSLQRHFYDATRKFFLAGRDALLDGIPLSPDATVLEMGCGTARNLVVLAKKHPGTRLLGLDASSKMLETARRKIARMGLQDRITLRRGLAETADILSLFGLSEPLDAVFFSYSLSMMKEPERALETAFDLLRPGGSLHAADFGGFEGFPRPVRTALLSWLGMFHVVPRPETMLHFLPRAAAERGLVPFRRSLIGGFAVIVRARPRT